jgi:hypothetical protein
MAGGAFWSTKTETGFAGVPVDLGRETWRSAHERIVAKT